MKKWIAILLATALVLGTLSGCGGKTGGGNSAPSDSGSSVSSDSESNSGSRSEPETPPEDSQPQETDPFVEVALGETITMYGVDYTFETQGTAKELLPSAPGSGGHWLIGERTGYTLFYVKGTVTNNSDADYNIEWIDVQCSRNGGSYMLDPAFYLDNKSGLTTTAIIAPGETYPFYFVDRVVATEWLENDYESYRFLFQCYDSREAIADKLEGGYALSFHK